MLWSGTPTLAEMVLSISILKQTSSQSQSVSHPDSQRVGIQSVRRMVSKPICPQLMLNSLEDQSRSQITLKTVVSSAKWACHILSVNLSPRTILSQWRLQASVVQIKPGLHICIAATPWLWFSPYAVIEHWIQVLCQGNRTALQFTLSH